MARFPKSLKALKPIVCISSALVIASLPCLPTQAQSLSEKVVAMERGLEEEFEGYFGTDLAEVTQAPEDIAQTLRRIGQETDSRPAVLWAIPKEDFLHLVLITPNGEPIVRDLHDVPESLLKATVNEFHLEIQTPPAFTDLAAAQQLYQWIIEPYESEFLAAENIDTILFCLGEGLRSLPVAALYDGNQFLLEKYSLSRIPAFNLTQTDYEPIEQTAILAMGASEFESLSPLPAVPSELRNVLAGWRLSHSRQGASALSTLSPQGQFFLNPDFTLANLKAQVERQSPDIVHLATHAAFRPGTPEESYIQLWDQQLRLDQLRQINWQMPTVELLVLSACQTAIGDATAELGFAGLALQAGVKSALASIWNVSDTGTLALMSELYRQLGTHQTKAEALRQAQLKMLRGEIRIEGNQLRLSRGRVLLPESISQEEVSDLSAPYYWAGFTIVGSPW